MELEVLVETANNISHLAQSHKRYTQLLKDMNEQVSSLLQRIDEVDDRIMTVKRTLDS